jgi:phosphatidylethanolamine-binding protein (PEBP) family uncharacterized protein
MFRIYVLDVELGLMPGASRDQIESAIRGHAVPAGQIIGIYARPGT